ncbi:MAG: Hsp20/alpha crystallin family protein [Acidobacteriota bacterium]|nr:Hsp20/alpha crystallin family protein [Acidobacteriota bacterium]
MATVLAKPTTEESFRMIMRQPLTIFEEMEKLSNEIQQRAFDLFKERGGNDGFDLGDWFEAEKELLRHIPVEVEVLDKEIVVRAEVPGFEVKDISVTLEPYRLTILAKKEFKEEKKEGKETTKHYSEISQKEAMRQVLLPDAVAPERTTARLEKGVLEVHMDKASPAKVIEVKATA